MAEAGSLNHQSRVPLRPPLRVQSNPLMIRSVHLDLPVHLKIVLTNKDSMEIPDKIAVPLLVVLTGFAVRLFQLALRFVRPRQAQNGRRVSLEEALADINGQLREIREVHFSDLNVRTGRMESEYRAVLRRIESLERRIGD